MALKVFPRPITCPGKPTVHRGFCCFGRKAERAMGKKKTQQFGGSLRGGLIRMVGKARSRLSRTPSPADGMKNNKREIVFTEALIESDHETEMVIKARLRNAIEEVTLKESGGKRTYANPAGHGLLEELQEMNKEVKNLREGATNQASLNASIDARVTQLQSFADGFKEVRQRIFTVYKRDIKGMSHLSRSKAIVVGNAHAHDADALMDAKLLDSDPFWPDRSTHCELYGCEFDNVLAYGKKFNEDARFLFGIFNAHANMLLQGKTLGRPLDAAFGSFLQAVERLSLEDSPTSLGMQITYRAFWNEF